MGRTGMAKGELGHSRFSSVYNMFEMVIYGLISTAAGVTPIIVIPIFQTLPF